MELSRDPGEAELSRGVDAGELYHGAVALYERQVQGEHIGLRGEVEEQLARPEPHLPGEPVLDALLQIGIVGGPCRRVGQIGRASCRGRGEISVVAVSFKKKKKYRYEAVNHNYKALSEYIRGIDRIVLADALRKADESRCA